MAFNDNLLSPEAIDDPHRVVAALREQDPVRWSADHQGWLLTRHDDVSAAFQNQALSSDRVRPLRMMGKLEPGSPADRIHELLGEFMVVKDPPEHTRLRRVANKAFRQQKVAAMGERIDQLVDSLLDDFIASGEEDLIAGFSNPLPTIVISDMLGAPLADSDKFKHWSDELALVAFGAGGEARSDRHERALRGLEEMQDYFRHLIALARDNPGEDMLSAMMSREDDPMTLSDDELVAMCALLLFAGHETTTNAIANGVVALLEHPDQLERLRENPGIAVSAVEELLRFEGPIKVLMRWVIEDFTLRDKRIHAGERVHLVLYGANRDPARFEDPDRLDLTRSPNPHLAFGKGIHACIGAQLARMETRSALVRLVQRLPNLRLADDTLVWNPALASRALKALPIAHDARQVSGV